MPDVMITVQDKIATGDGQTLVCNNSDYLAVFKFDNEWQQYNAKTMRVHFAGKYIDVPFSGFSAPLPKIDKCCQVKIGVYAGDLHCTTPAYFSCAESILTQEGLPEDPPQDIYSKIIELISRESMINGGTFNDWRKVVVDGGTFKEWSES